MKKNITVEQLNELSDKAKEKLRERWKPEEGDLVIFLQDGNHFDKETFVVGTGTFLTDKGWGVNYEDQAGLMPKENVYPLLSIGQMIEFLPNFKEITKVEGEFTDTDREDYEDLTDDEFNLVKKQGFVYHVYYRTHNSFFHHPELCDALWEAAKYILEDNNDTK